jgi:hypothetical protein
MVVAPSGFFENTFMCDLITLERGASDKTRYHFEFAHNPFRKSILICAVIRQRGREPARAQCGAALFLWSAALRCALGRRLHLIGECAFHLRCLLVLLRLPDLAIASYLSFCHR